jgi:hypothetical protein
VDSREARRILALYRRGREDADPLFAEALAAARQDPELARWLEAQRRADAAIRRKLTGIDPPADLRARILVAGRAAAASGQVPESSEGQIASAPAERDRDPARIGQAASAPRRFRRRWLAWPVAAAAVIVVAVYSGLRVSNRQDLGFSPWRQKMAAFVSKEYKLDLHEEEYTEMRERLVAGGYPSIPELWPALAGLALEGGSQLEWNGHKVTLVCMEAGEDHDVWLFLAERAAVPDAPAAGSPVLATIEKMPTASWTRGDLVFLLVVQGDAQELPRYLPPSG